MGQRWRRRCRKRADVMMQIDANGIVADNLWLWLADHSTDSLDGCLNTGNDIVATPPTAAMVSTSDTALLVNGDDVIVYGLEAEHNRADIVSWHGGVVKCTCSSASSRTRQM